MYEDTIIERVAYTPLTLRSKSIKLANFVNQINWNKDAPAIASLPLIPPYAFMRMVFVCVTIKFDRLLAVWLQPEIIGTYVVKMRFHMDECKGFF